MVTYTYFVHKYFVDGDPRPKYIASSISPSELYKIIKDRGLSFDNSEQMLVTVTNEVPDYRLTNHDHCTFCNDCFNPESKLFCGVLVIHYKKVIWFGESLKD